MLFKGFPEVKLKTNMNLLKVGIVGSVVAALCCFTPLLVILFSAVGLASAVGYLDYVLLPSLAIFIGITAYALITRNLT